MNHEESFVNIERLVKFQDRVKETLIKNSKPVFPKVSAKSLNTSKNQVKAMSRDSSRTSFYNRNSNLSSHRKPM